MKLSVGKIIGLALLAGLVPYRFKSDKETGEFEVGGLLWGLKKTPGEDKNHYTFAIPPSGLEYDAAREAEAPVSEN